MRGKLNVRFLESENLHVCIAARVGEMVCWFLSFLLTVLPIEHMLLIIAIVIFGGVRFIGL